MIDSKELLYQLRKSTLKLERKIKYKKLYNFRNYIITGLINSGIVIDFIAPYILAGMILFDTTFEENNPFVLDDFIDPINVETMITSTGLEKKNITYDVISDGLTFEHSTSWKINQYGLYERTVTLYEIDDTIDLSNTDKILSMSKEEIENKFVIKDIQVIQKNQLNSDDVFYNSDMLIINTVYKDYENGKIRKETEIDNTIILIHYLFVSIVWGKAIKGLSNVFIRTSIHERLKNLKEDFKLLEDEELEKLNKILEIKKSNLNMLDDNSKSLPINCDREYPYKLKRI